MDTSHIPTGRFLRLIYRNKMEWVLPNHVLLLLPDFLPMLILMCVIKTCDRQLNDVNIRQYFLSFSPPPNHKTIILPNSLLHDGTGRRVILPH